MGVGVGGGVGEGWSRFSWAAWVRGSACMTPLLAQTRADTVVWVRK